jgi:prepilin peptidase CpaA
MIEIIALTVFAGLLVYAACSDIASLTIPNWVSIALALAFPPLALAGGVAPAEIGMHVLFGGSVLAVGFFLFQANIIGGGDAKLLASATVWIGFTGLPMFLVSTAVAGGALAALLLAARRVAGSPAAYPAIVERLLTPRSGVPYGVAIMAGGLMAIPALPFQFGSLTLP